MVMNTSKTSGSPRTKKQVEQEQVKAGKKRAMQDSSSEEDEEDDEVTLETLKKLSKKMKPSAKEVDSEDDDEGSDEDDEDLEGDSEDDDDEGSDEEEDDDDDEQDDEESDEEQRKPVINKVKPQSSVQPKKAPQMNGSSKAPEKAAQVSVDGNAVVIFNLDKMVRHENLKDFIETKSGVSCNTCFVSTKSSAIITTKNKQDADKILKACQSTLYQGSQMQLCTIASGVVSQPKAPVLKSLEDIEPAKTMLVYSLTTNPPLEAVKKLVPNAIECHKSHSGIFMSFNNLEEAKDAFVKLGKAGTIDGVKCMVKYVKNSHVSSVFTGKETRVLLYNLPYAATKAQVQELVPKATFVHFNPVSWGSWIVEFGSPKDCKDAGERLNNYDMNGRAIRVSFAASECWDIKFNAKAKINDAQMHFHKQFPDMIDFHVMTVVYKQKRAPAFMLTFKNREAWQRALDKALNLHSIAGVQIYVANQGKLREEFVKKDKQPASAPKIKAKQEPVPMDEDEDESDDDDDEEADEDDGDSEEEEEVQQKKSQPVKPSTNKGFPAKRGGGGGAKFGGQQRGGRGGNFRGRGGPQRGRGGNFRGRGK